MLTNFEIILVTLALLASLVILYFFFKSFFTRKLMQNTISDVQPMLFDDEIQKVDIYKQELIILNLISMDKSNYNSNQILTLLKNLGAKYTNGFFGYYDISDKEIFRIASGINPGLLEAETKTYILLLAMDLYKTINPTKAFETMLQVATEIAEKIDATICDESRGPISKQMIEHLRSKAQEASIYQTTQPIFQNER